MHGIKKRPSRVQGSEGVDELVKWTDFEISIN